MLERSYGGNVKRSRGSSDARVFVEIHDLAAGCYARATVEGAQDRFPRMLVGIFGSGDEAIAQVTGRALGWLRRLREDRACPR